MSVADELGLWPGCELLKQADQSWDGWCEQHPALRVAGDVESLQRWLRGQDAVAADPALMALVTLGSPQGGDDLAAVAVVAWSLMPAACTIADRLRAISVDINQVVAGQLWLEIRGFPWRRLRKVASNIVLNTRFGVLRDVDPLYRRKFVELPTDPHDCFWSQLDQGTESQATVAEADLLLDLLDGACSQQVISGQDRSLLVSLAQAACDSAQGCDRGRGGLMANDMNTRFAAEVGMSVTMLRRRTRRTLQSLQAYAPKSLAG